MAAAAAGKAAPSDEPFGRKRRCHVWLDALFRALCDLQDLGLGLGLGWGED